MGTDGGGFGGGAIDFASVSLTIFPPQADTRQAASSGTDRRKLWVKNREEFMGETNAEESLDSSQPLGAIDYFSACGNHNFIVRAPADLNLAPFH